MITVLGEDSDGREACFEANRDSRVDCARMGSFAVAVGGEPSVLYTIGADTCTIIAIACPGQRYALGHFDGSLLGIHGAGIYEVAVRKMLDQLEAEHAEHIVLSGANDGAGNDAAIAAAVAGFGPVTWCRPEAEDWYDKGYLFTRERTLALYMWMEDDQPSLRTTGRTFPY
ncbi:MAG: hypothetical protein KC486_24555 [Myxococcales bacterium]|nr:hypothetical protein [Myxococcales bacterium]